MKKTWSIILKVIIAVAGAIAGSGRCAGSNLVIDYLINRYIYE